MPNYRRPESLLARLATGALKGYVMDTEQERDQAYRQQEMAQREGYLRERDTQDRGFRAEQNQLDRDAAAEIARKKLEWEEKDARSKRLYKIFHGDENEVFGDTAEEFEQKQQIEAKYRKPDKETKGSDPMIEINRDYPDATANWKRSVKDNIKNGMSYDQAVVAAGDAEAKGPTAAWIQTRADKIEGEWASGERELPAGFDDPAQQRELAELMASKNINQFEALKVMQTDDLAADLAGIVDVDDPTAPILEPQRLQEAAKRLGKPIKLKEGLQSLHEIATLAFTSDWSADDLARLLREYQASNIQSAYQKAIAP